jgi:DNA-binding NtrC family response regulator
MAPRILLADDDHDTLEGLSTLLAGWGYEVAQASDGESAFKRALEFRPDLVIADLVMEGMDGLALASALQQECPTATVIILTGNATVDTAVAAMKRGVYDYLTKPVDTRRLRPLIEKALEKSEIVREVTLLRKQLKEARGLGRLLGTSRPMQEIYHLVEMAATTDAPVLISGESGTGKELVARTLHELSARRKAPFVAVNCSAIPESLLESELFGHEKGAFTGALDRRAGYFELADRGTIFLDEIVEMSPALQAKYLRILQEGTVRRLGAKGELSVDVRIVAATNKDPMKAVKDGIFREDLFYRLNVFAINMPPLRQRKDDIPLIVEAFIEEFNAKYDKRVKGVDEGTLKTLMQWSWPGNVRELRNVIERATVASPGDFISRDQLPVASPAAAPAAASPAVERDDVIVIPVGTTLDDAERDVLLRTLARHNGNKTRAADVLGITPKTLRSKLVRYEGQPVSS